MPAFGSPSVTAFVALGGNLGDVRAAFARALAALVERGVEVVAVSRAYRTQAMLPAELLAPQPDYWNAVVEIRTTLAAPALLELLHRLEAAAGRIRRARWQPRPLDLDLLLYGDAVSDAPNLRLPHPGLCDRLFVLRPLSDLAAELPLPPDGPTVRALLARHPDQSAGILEVTAGPQPVGRLQ